VAFFSLFLTSFRSGAMENSPENVLGRQAEDAIEFAQDMERCNFPLFRVKTRRVEEVVSRKEFQTPLNFARARAYVDPSLETGRAILSILQAIEEGTYVKPQWKEEPKIGCYQIKTLSDMTEDELECYHAARMWR